MLLLHGFPELWTMWEKQMSAFKNDYNVAAIDMRGYGRSDRPTVRCTTANLRQHYTYSKLATAAPLVGNWTYLISCHRLRKQFRKEHAVIAGEQGLLH